VFWISSNVAILSITCRNQIVAQDELKNYMKDRKFVPISTISQLSSHDAIPGNWVSIGIVSNKISPKPTKNGDT
jgi:hypothetical protein